MAGAISGAHLGISAIPPRLSYHLTDRGTWGHIELVELAHKCYEIKAQSVRKPSFAGFDPHNTICCILSFPLVGIPSPDQNTAEK